ncbi:hypothetical protein G3M48_005463 [Beauveria asiatica]|uniref:Uncharacterized protein n=1 Tax=Beauveria asiatica TaxID=1069075 RepID=A0AAW0RR40_9HYPO
MPRPQHTNIHYILNSAHMWKIYEEAKGYEPYSVRFWNPLLNRDFRLEDGWIVAPEQLVHRDTRNGDQRMDTYVEWFDEDQHLHIGMMLHEAKKEAQSAKELEKQAVSYAKDVISERSLAGLYILTTIGTKFRTWYLASGDDSLRALDGGIGMGSRSLYHDAATTEASDIYAYFVQQVKGDEKLLRAPVLPSQAHLLPAMHQVSHGPSIGESSSSAAMEAAQSSEKVQIIWVSTTVDSAKGIVNFEYNGANIRSPLSSWVFDPDQRAHIFKSKTYDKTFGAPYSEDS